MGADFGRNRRRAKRNADGDSGNDRNNQIVCEPTPHPAIIPAT